MSSLDSSLLRSRQTDDAPGEARIVNAEGASEPAGGTLIVLDTNVFFGDRYAQHELLTAVLRGAAAGDYAVVVPAVVIRELVKQFGPALTKAVADVNQAIARASRDMRRFSLAAPLQTEVDVDALVPEYERSIRKRLTDHNVRIVDDPAQFSTALDWAVSRRKPFKSDGQGLPDAAIWLSVLDAARGFEVVLLVSENTLDFGDGEDPPRLASELADDLGNRGLPVDKVRLVTTLRELVEELLPPLSAADARATRMLTDIGIRSRLLESLSAAMLYNPIPQDGLDLPIELEQDPQPLSIAIDEPRLLSARSLSEERLLLDLEAVADAVLSFKVDKDDLMYLDEERIDTLDEDSSEHYADVESRVELELRLQASTDLRGTDVHITDVNVRELTVDERMQRRIDDEFIEDLRLAADAAVARAAPNVTGFVPPYPVEGRIDQASLIAFRAAEVEIGELAEHDAEHITVEVRLSGLGTIDWLLTAPTPADLTHYDKAEARDDLPDLIARTEHSEVVNIDVEVSMSWDGDLLDVTVVGADQRP